MAQVQEVVNGVIRYFDLFSRRRSTIAGGFGAGGQTVPPWWWQLLLYAALLAGIIAKGLLEYFTGKNPEPFRWGRLFASLVAATVLFPGAYRAAMEDAGPGLVQLCVVFTSGIGIKAVVDAPK